MSTTEDRFILKYHHQKQVQLFATQPSPSVIVLEAEGYGHRTGDGVPGDGNGTNDIVMMEHYDGKLRLIVWGDINEEDPTHIIDLENARESNRRSDT